MSSAAASPRSNADTGRRVHLALTALVLLTLFVQVYLAGRGIFGQSSFSAHETVGRIMQGVALVLLVVTVAVPSTRTAPDIGQAGALFVLLGVQGAIGERDHPAIAAFHPVLAVIIIGLVFGMVKTDRSALA